MKRYGLIAVGSGTAVSLVEPFLEAHPEERVAVIDKDVPGGICLTRGCIPTKLLTYPAEVVRLIERAREFGIDVAAPRPDFKAVMARMHAHIDPEIAGIREGLSSHPSIDYYHAAAEFTGPRAMRVAGQDIQGERIVLGTGSRPGIPPVPGLKEAGYFTSDTVLGLEELPARLAIIGCGYIGAEFGHFFSAMGSEVTCIGRNPRFLPDEEPEIGAFAAAEFGQRVRLLLNMEAVQVQARGRVKVLHAKHRGTGKVEEVEADAILVAAGREPTHDLLHAERAGIQLDPNGWIVVNEHLETTAKNVWALGDANGFHQFKHKANYEATLLYRNLFEGARLAADYHAVPHAVFGEPEIAGVGVGEAEAVREHGEAAVVVGYQRFEDTAKGQAMGARGFVKALIHAPTGAILGCHIVGPQASVLLQEVVTVMNTPGRKASAVRDSMHIHPALSEVVERAFGNAMSVAEYHALRAEEAHEAHATTA